MITGIKNPIVGKEEFYLFSDPFDTFNVSNATFVWNIWKKNKNGSWINITQKPEKMGQKVSFKFGEKVIGVEFKLEVYKATKKPLSNEFKEILADEILVIPRSAKTAKIDKVILFSQGARDPNKASYKDFLIARAYCIGMFNQEVEFRLWEDDAPGGGHNAAINKNNQFPQVFKATVDHKGIAEVKISLSANEKVLKAIANKYLMKGDADEGANHEFYVTASYNGKIQKASQVNVDVANPDYKAKPKQNSPKFPATTDSKSKKQPDPKGKITDAYFVNDKNQKLYRVPIDYHVKVQILSTGMKDRFIQYVVWEEDLNFFEIADSHDEIYRSGRIKIGGDVITTDGFKITEPLFKKGVSKMPGDTDNKSQNYFLEIIIFGSEAESSKFGLDDKVGQKMEVVRSAAVVNGKKPVETNTTCICKEQYKDLVWGGKVSCDFRKKVVEIAKNLGLPQKNYEGANWLMTIMALESAYSFSPKCGTFGKNPDESSKYKYVGLIQFGKAAAEEVGTTRTHLMSLTAEKQLDYVEKHYKKKQFKNLLNNRTALYLAVNYPNATIHASEKDYVVYDSTKDAYDDNPMFKRESHEFWIDKKGKKNYHEGKEGKSFVWEFEEALKEVEDLGKSHKTKTFTCGVSSTQNDKINAKDIVTYHIFHDGKIEKHIPKTIKPGYEKKYKYVYHDSKNGEHEICLADWHTTKEKGVGQVYKTKPTHSKVISDKNVSEGNTSRRVKYENGDIAEYGSHPRKGIIWLLYKAGKSDVELLRMPDNLNYKKDNVSISYSFTGTQRRYTGVHAFAGFIGYLAKSGLKLQTSGSCFSEGSSFPSQEHCNGRSVDTYYLKVVENDQKVIDSAIFFHFTEVLTGEDSYCKKLKRAGNGGTLHNSHLHSGNFDSSIIKIIKEK